MATNKVLTIEFSASGDQKLVKALKRLDVVIKQLEGKVSKYENELKKAQNTQNKAAKSLSVLQGQVNQNKIEFQKFAPLIKMSSQELKKLGLSTKIVKLGLEGDAKALALVKRAFKNAGVDMKQFSAQANITSTSLFKMGHSARNTTGAFSVLRSQLLLTSFAMGLAIRPMLNLAKSAGDLQEIISKSNVVFGQNMGVVKRWADGLSKSVGRAKSTLLEMASSLQDTFVPLGFTRDAATRLSTSLTELALDVASFSNKLDADVIRDFQSALVGNHETVKKYGIIINEQRVKQEALTLGIAKSNKKLTEAQKVQARVSLLQKGSSDAIGDLKRTQDSYNNSLKSFNESWKELSEVVGETIQPLIIAMTEFLTDEDKIKSYAISIGLVATGFGLVKIHALGAASAITTFKKAMAKTVIAGLVIALGELVSRFSSVNDEIEDIDGLLENAKREMRGFKIQVGEADKAIQLFNKNFVFDEEELKKLTDLEPGQLKKQIKEIEKEIENYKDSIKEADAMKISTEINPEVDTSEAQTVQEEIFLATTGNKDGILTLDIIIPKSFENIVPVIPTENLEILGEYTKNTENLVNELESMGTQVEIVRGVNGKLFAGVSKGTLNIEGLKEVFNSLNSVSGSTIEIIDNLVTDINTIETDKTVEQLGNIVDITVEYDEKIAELNAQLAILVEALTQVQNTTEEQTWLEKHTEDIESAITLTQEFSGVIFDIADSYMAVAQAQMTQAKEGEIAAAESIRNETIRQQTIDKINKKYAAKQDAINKKTKRIKRAQTVVNTSVGIMEAYASTELGAVAKHIMAALVATSGAMQLKVIDSQKMQYGGMVGGNRHAQGGTMIEAERGEYVVSREGVESVGIENLNRINAGGGGGGTSIVINNPVLGKDMIEDEIVPQIQEALRRGGSIA